MHVYKIANCTRFQNGEIIMKKELKQCGVLDFPYRFIRNYGPATIGVSDLPETLFTKEYLCPAVNVDNIGDKLHTFETMLHDYGINISFNLYQLGEDRVHNTIVSSEKTVFATRVTASVILREKSRTSLSRQHASSYNLMLSSILRDGKQQQFHCQKCLNVGKFMYYNTERFHYDKGPDELAKY